MKFKNGQTLSANALNQLMSKEDIITIHKKILDEFYSKKNLKPYEALRKKEIEFIISYLEFDDIYESLTSESA